MLEIIADAKDGRVPPAARGDADALARQYSAVGAEIGSIEPQYRGLAPFVRGEPAGAKIPGIGPIVATALVAEMGDWKALGSGRTARRRRSGWCPAAVDRRPGQTWQYHQQGNRYLRWLLSPARSPLSATHKSTARRSGRGLGRLMERRPTKLAADPHWPTRLRG